MDMFPLTWIFLALYFSGHEVRGQAGKPPESFFFFFFFFHFSMPLPLKTTANAGGHTQWQEKEDRSILNNLERDPSQPSLYHHRC